jgi:hypothetical protein
MQLQVVLPLVSSVAQVALISRDLSAVLPTVRAQGPYVFVGFVTVGAKDPVATLTILKM